MKPRLPRDERGAYLILWAVLITGLLTMVAIVIDLGRLRDTRRQAQRAADLAAVAAGQDIAGGSIVNACRSAIQYVRTNLRDLSTLSDTCAATFTSGCPVTPTNMVTTSGRYTITIRNPVPNNEIEDPSYPVNPSTGTRTLNSDGEPCERMRVTVEQTNSTFFAGVIGVGSLHTEATAVVRGFIGENPKQNAGLVVLERKGCNVIETGGGGSSQASVLVKGSFSADGNPRPGIIQIDSKALEAPSGGDCTTGGDVPAKYAVFGARLTPSADRPLQPSVEAEAIGGAPGRLDMYALTINRNNAHAAHDVPGGGVSPAPTPGALASRTVVDDVYNAAGAGTNRVTTLKTNSTTLLSTLNAAVAACPTCNVVPPPAITTPACSVPNYYVYPPPTAGPDPNGCLPIAPPAGTLAPTCSSNTATLIDVTATYDKVFVKCDDLDVRQIRMSGRSFVFSGKINVAASGNSALFPNATEMIVAGCGSCTGGAANRIGINVSGSLIVNSGPNTPLAKQCDDNIDNDLDGQTDEFNPVTGTGDVGCQSVSGWDEISCTADRNGAAVAPNRLVLLTGPIETSASSGIEFCQTFVLLADGASLPDQDVSSSTDPTCAGLIDITGALVPKPCPRNNSYKGTLRIKGDIDWSAPDQTSAPRDTSLPLQNFEDLALWTEASAASEIGGPGATVTAGVYFFPNAPTTFSGQASQFIDLNAQYIARKLFLSGLGTLSMKPNPDDVVETPAPFFALIR